MTALGEIEAAIENLERLRADATQGRWDWIVGMSTGDARLVATLHRTIDAQLKILTGSAGLHAKYADVGRETEWIAAVERAGDLDLARAINGGQS